MEGGDRYIIRDGPSIPNPAKQSTMSAPSSPFFAACETVTITANAAVQLHARVRNAVAGPTPIAVLIHGYPQS